MPKNKGELKNGCSKKARRGHHNLQAGFPAAESRKRAPSCVVMSSSLGRLWNTQRIAGPKAALILSTSVLYAFIITHPVAPCYPLHTTPARENLMSWERSATHTLTFEFKSTLRAAPLARGTRGDESGLRDTRGALNPPDPASTAVADSAVPDSSCRVWMV